MENMEAGLFSSVLPWCTAPNFLLSAWIVFIVLIPVFSGAQLLSSKEALEEFLTPQNDVVEDSPINASPTPDVQLKSGESCTTEESIIVEHSDATETVVVTALNDNVESNESEVLETIVAAEETTASAIVPSTEVSVLEVPVKNNKRRSAISRRASRDIYVPMGSLPADDHSISLVVTAKADVSETHSAKEMEQNNDENIAPSNNSKSKTSKANSMSVAKTNKSPKKSSPKKTVAEPRQTRMKTRAQQERVILG